MGFSNASVPALSHQVLQVITLLRRGQGQGLLLKSLNTIEHDRSDDNTSATENAVSSLGKILEFQPDIVEQSKSLADTWVQSLPILEDSVEAVKVHAQLVRFIEKQDPRYLLEASVPCKLSSRAG